MRFRASVRLAWIAIGCVSALAGAGCTPLREDDSKSPADASTSDAAVSGALPAEMSPALAPSGGSGGSPSSAPDNMAPPAVDAGGPSADASCASSDCACDPDHGCCADSDCPAGEACKDGACECPAETRRCGGQCVAESADSCGAACAACIAPSGGDAACVDGACRPTCPAGQKPCAGTCIAESAPCSAECPAQSHDCSGVCIPNDSVNGCGADSCTPCASPSGNGHATCDGQACDVACDPNFKRCQQDCIPNGACCTAADCGTTGWSCSAAHSCQCATGYKSCKGGCIPSGDCCQDTDCGAGHACTGGQCVSSSWCSQRSRPSGVAASDYRCLDFEDGLPASSEWTQQVAGQGTLAISTSRASSLPSSALSTVAAETMSANADRGLLSFNAVGGASVTSATVRVEVNPSGFPSFGTLWTGSVDLLSVSNNNDTFTVEYTYSQDYVGFSFTALYSGGIAFLYSCPISASIPANNWTTIELRLGTTADAALLINGTAVSAPDCAVRLTANSSLKADIGLAAFPNTAAGMSVSFDNIEVAVHR